MNIKDLIGGPLMEGNSDILYHYTSGLNAVKILEDGKFDLSMAVGKADLEHNPNNYFYFLSTSRSKTGAFHSTAHGFAAMFNLDGRWISERYKSKPVDYWGSREHRSEAEDRIFSKESTMPITPVTSVHVLLKEDGDYDNQFNLKKIIAYAKARGIPLYYYNDETMWRLQSKKGRLELPRGYNRLEVWYNLATSPNTDINQFNYRSDEHNILSHLTYHDLRDAYNSFSSEMHNSKKDLYRKSAEKIINFMQKNKIKSTNQFVDYIRSKYNL